VPLDPRNFLGEPPAAWRIVAERKIQAWIDEGGPERLTNKGKPLDLSENPFTPADLRMAFKVMKNADVAPDWIEIAKEIEAELSKAREDGRRFHDGQRRDRILIRSAPDAHLDEIRARMRDRAGTFADAQRSRYRHVNGLIDRFNTACPVAHLHRGKLNLDREVEQALRAAPGVAA
jgi:hypothetical protein